MATGQWEVVLRHVRRLFDGGSVSGLSEGQLLDRFASNRDEVAFGALIARHGPMVLGVCRGVLNDPHDVDDAFQATFLVLVKKAGALRDGDRLAQWLYGVARKVALRARADSTRRKARERPEAAESLDHRATLDADLRELQSTIREEVDRLSTNDRMAVVLCYLEGLTHEEAADRLGWPVGTVKGRLARAREKLKGRLTRRGVALPTVAIGSTFAEAASAAVPRELIRATTLAAVQMVSGKTMTAGIVSAHALTLMEGTIGTMYATKLKIAATALIASCAVGVPGVMAFQGPGSRDGAGKPTAPPSKSAPASRPSQGQPVGQVVRPGSGPDVAREEEARLADEALQLVKKTILDPNARVRPSPDQVYLWSRRIAEAKLGPNAPQAARIAALEAHRDRMRENVKLVTELVNGETYTRFDLLDAQFHALEADRWVREGGFTEGRPMPPAVDATLMFGPDRRPLILPDAPGDEKRNEAILAKLEDKLSMNFASETPLADIKKYIEAATQDDAAGFATGLPIYVDPQALEANDKTMASTVTIHLEGIPLRTTLRLLLHQLDLDYRVEGGLLLITDQPPRSSLMPGGRPAANGGVFKPGAGGGFR